MLSKQCPAVAVDKVAYVVKMYPRYSETFIVSEILAHEAAGLELEVFSLRAPVDTHFQDILARVRSPVHYVPCERPRAAEFWSLLGEAGARLPRFWQSLGTFANEDLRDVQQAVVLAMHLLDGGFTHIHAHFASVATTVARMASRFTGIPYTFTAHAKDIFHESVDQADLRRKLSDARATVTVSDYNLKYLRSLYGQAAARVQRVYNGLALALFPFEAPVERQKTIVAVGRLVEKKGFADLIAACCLLNERGLSVKCRIIGSGMLEHELGSQLRALGMSSQVSLVGPLPQHRVVEEIRTAAVLAAPCVGAADGNRDGLPTVLLEAMALGTPCVSTPVTGIPEAIKHGETGLLVEEHDIGALADALERLLRNRSLRCELAEKARDHLEREFDVDRNSVQLRELFHGGSATGAEAA